MAIRLEVESYCDDCLDFEADVESLRPITQISNGTRNLEIR